VGPAGLAAQLGQGGQRPARRGDGGHHAREPAGPPRSECDGAHLETFGDEQPVQVDRVLRARRGVGVGQDLEDPRRRAGWPARVRGAQVSCASTRCCASSSLTSRAKLSSDTSTLRAFTNIDFSPADRPLDWSRRARFRTTSATWYTSPDLSFSWWFLK